MQCIELRLQIVEAVGYNCNFLLSAVELSFEFLEGWIVIVNDGVVVDNNSFVQKGISVVIGDLKCRFIREFCVVKAEGDGLPGKYLSLGLKPNDNVLNCRIEAQSEVFRVDLAPVDIECEGGFDVL